MAKSKVVASAAEATNVLMARTAANATAIFFMILIPVHMIRRCCFLLSGFMGSN